MKEHYNEYVVNGTLRGNPMTFRILASSEREAEKVAAEYDCTNITVEQASMEKRRHIGKKRYAFWRK